METILGIDLQTWWFLVVGGVFSAYAILDGFDLGAGALQGLSAAASQSSTHASERRA